VSAALAFEGVRLSFGAGGARTTALDGVDLEVAAGEFVCLLGPSGSGKSTLLALAAGLLSPEAGRVTAAGRPVDGPGVERGLVFQKHSLFPWETARGNVEFGPRMRGVPAPERRRLAAELLEAVGLADLAERYPRRLSEGQRQRVGLARALANEPRVLLMDEPFASLDALTRRQMQELLTAVWGRHRSSVLFVTHDVDEALALGDRVAVLSARPGRILLDRRVPRPRDKSALFAPETVALREECLRALGA
jgi:NitT/TauT family transport system ATP-binding protein